MYSIAVTISCSVCSRGLPMEDLFGSNASSIFHWAWLKSEGYDLILIDHKLRALPAFFTYFLTFQTSSKTLNTSFCSWFNSNQGWLRVCIDLLAAAILIFVAPQIGALGFIGAWLAELGIASVWAVVVAKGFLAVGGSQFVDFLIDTFCKLG